MVTVKRGVRTAFSRLSALLLPRLHPFLFPALDFLHLHISVTEISPLLFSSPIKNAFVSAAEGILPPVATEKERTELKENQMQKRNSVPHLAESLAEFFDPLFAETSGILNALVAQELQSDCD